MAPATDTSEKGLESVIVAAMTGKSGVAPPQPGEAADSEGGFGGAGWILGDAKSYDREYAVDLAQLSDFIFGTQKPLIEAFDLEHESPTRRGFLARLQGEIAKRGVIDVLRRGIKHGPHHVDLLYGTPSPGNEKAEKLFAENRFTVTRQLKYSRDETQLALDLCLFINGLSIATFELKNSLTKQTVADAVEQYKRDRDARELLFRSDAPLCTSRWMTTKFNSAPISRARLPGFCLSTKAGMTAPAIRPTRTGLKPTTSGNRC
jgi:type I restriction enzyme R subunit